jgi:hypothetical protein
VRGPNADSLAAVDSPSGTDGPEPLAFVTGSEGPYAIEVAALERGATAPILSGRPAIVGVLALHQRSG